MPGPVRVRAAAGMRPGGSRPTGGPKAFRNASKGLRGLLGAFAHRGGARNAAPTRGEARSAVLALGVSAGLLLLVTELLTLYSVEVLGASCEELAGPQAADRCAKSGGEQHGYLLVVVGLLVLVMAYGAAVGRSRPAGAALAACGGVVLALALARDLPDSGQAGPIGPYFDAARAVRGPALWTELAGGALALLAGAAALSAYQR